MENLAANKAVKVPSLPPASPELEGATYYLASTGHPYWCDGTAWFDMLAASVGGTQNVWVQPTPPVIPTTGLWIQTGLGVSGTDITFWIEDGT
mgnify:CR=1 FL=1